MITDALLSFVLGLLDFLAGLFPEVDFDPVELLMDALSHLADLNYYLPISEMVAVFVTFLLVVPVLAGTTLLVWGVSFLRGANARA